MSPVPVAKHAPCHGQRTRPFTSTFRSHRAKAGRARERGRTPFLRGAPRCGHLWPTAWNVSASRTSSTLPSPSAHSRILRRAVRAARAARAAVLAVAQLVCLRDRGLDHARTRHGEARHVAGEDPHVVRPQQRHERAHGPQRLTRSDAAPHEGGAPCLLRAHSGGGRRDKDRLMWPIGHCSTVRLARSLRRDYSDQIGSKEHIFVYRPVQMLIRVDLK